jgi:hypothetical protein
LDLAVSLGFGGLTWIWQSYWDYAKSEQALSPVFREAGVVGERYDENRRGIVAADSE